MFDLQPFFNNRRSNSLWDGSSDLLGSSSNLFDEFMNSNLSPFKVDIQEDNDKYLLEAELPGVKKEDIKLEVDDQYLNIMVSNSEEVEEKKDNYIRKERRAGSYSRSFRVGNIVEDKVEAEYNNGILEVILPKKEIEKDDGKRVIDIK
ncbi:Hsp20/alpha crystallin family protein [Halonatronum saccharophilum]|uniref:Hsp20/alpha crystallin family protein n=1 Tax=Halonatronum saccharophilum TaxID=150060 RepID=UPI0004812064|nr:Hsp20/alpha crystallin family protein [Halonatronum saccharophilum]